MSLGIGFGAFAQGLSNGLNAGIKLGTAFKARQTQNDRQKTIDEAKKEYDAANPVQQPGTADQPGIGAQPGAAAAPAQPRQSFEEFLYKTKMPKIIDGLVASGDLEGAEKYRKWTEDRNERGFMKSFGNALSAWQAGASSGDYSRFADSAVDLLNKGNYGIKADGYDFIKDSDGKTTGLTFNLNDGKTKFKHTFNSIDDAAKFLAAQGDPAARVKLWQDEQKKATDLKAKVAEKQIDNQLGIKRDAAKEDRAQTNRLELQERKADDQLRLEATKKKGGTVQANAEYKARALRENGFSEEEVRDLMPSILGVEQNRKGVSMSERVRMTRQTLMQNDMAFATLKPEQQEAKIRRIIEADDLIAKSMQPERKQSAPQSPPPVYR